MSSSNNDPKSGVPQQEPPQEDHNLPLANVTRIMRKILPPDAKISKEAKAYIQALATEYIRFVTSEANDICLSDRRNLITAGEILSAMTKLGFEDYVEPLSVFIDRYRLLETDRGWSLRGESSSAYEGSGIGFHVPPHHGSPPHGTLPYGPPPSGFHGPPPHGPTLHGPLPYGPPLQSPLPHGPPPPGPYGYGTLDQSMVMGGGGWYNPNGSDQNGTTGGGGWYNPNGSDQDGTTGGGGSSSSMNGMPFSDQYGQYKWR